ncbi:hypothetical protein IWX76_002879 [Pedobacter sp. CAN_A7]
MIEERAIIPANYSSSNTFNFQIFKKYLLVIETESPII